MTPRRIILVSAGVLIGKDNRILLAERPKGKSMAGLWEFPGGKVHENELPEDALIRELHEELGIALDREKMTPVTFASHAYPDFHLLMPVFICRNWQGEPHPREGQKLVWVKKEDLDAYALPPADEALLPILLKLI